MKILKLLATLLVLFIVAALLGCSEQGNTLIFPLTAKMGWVITPIEGTVEVTDRDVTIDADLGPLERLISSHYGARSNN